MKAKDEIDSEPLALKIEIEIDTEPFALEADVENDVAFAMEADLETPDVGQTPDFADHGTACDAEHDPTLAKLLWTVLLDRRFAFWMHLRE